MAPAVCVEKKGGGGGARRGVPSGDAPDLARLPRPPRRDVDPAGCRPASTSTRDFPVLSAGPTPRTPLDQWSFTIDGAVERAARWTWEEFLALPAETFTVDIHCVTKWTKLDTTWTGVSLDTLLERRRHRGRRTSIAWCDGGYTTNLPLEDLTDGKAWVAYDSRASRSSPSTAARRGCSCRTCTSGRARSGCAGCALTTSDEPGFWEAAGYHDHGDPWREQRYQGD